MSIRKIADSVYSIIRYYDYGITLRISGKSVGVEISEPLFFNDAYDEGLDALCLVQRAILWVFQNEDDFIACCVRNGVCVRAGDE